MNIEKIIINIKRFIKNGKTIEAKNLVIDLEKKEGIYHSFDALFSIACYYFIENNFHDARKYFELATKLGESNEVASLSYYVCLTELNEDVLAILELNRFLSKYPAKLYRDTLSELLIGLDNGYATNFKEIIYELAKKNNININK
jgi:hypothetical protein